VIINVIAIDPNPTWSPPGSERIYGTRLSYREKEEQVRGREDISHPELTGCQRVMAPWLATCTNVIKI